MVSNKEKFYTKPFKSKIIKAKWRWKRLTRLLSDLFTEASLHRCSYKMMFWRYAANIQENTHVEEWFQWSSKATLLKSHFGCSLVNLLYISRMPFPKSTSTGLLLYFLISYSKLLSWNINEYYYQGYVSGSQSKKVTPPRFLTA